MYVVVVAVSSPHQSPRCGVSRFQSEHNVFYIQYSGEIALANNHYYYYYNYCSNIYIFITIINITMIIVAVVVVVAVILFL